MAVQSDTSSISYTGNNSTVTTYAVPFVFLENSHLAATAKVIATGVETAVTLTNHTGAGSVNGGTVRTAVAVPATSTLLIYRTVPATQTTTYAEGGDFPAASHERALDKLTFITQQNKRATDRSFRVTEGSGEKNEVVAVPNTLLGLDSNNQPKALTLSEVKSYLALTGTTLTVPAGSKTFADAGERALAVPDFTGQLGTQRDTNDVYISTGTAAGDWSLVDENMSLADFAFGFFTADATGRGKFGSGFVDSALLASNSVETDKINNGAVTTAKFAYDSGPISGFRNAIINGNFDIWQRGTSSSSNGYVAADRWANSINGSSCTMSRQSFALGQTDVPHNPEYFCRMAVTSSAGASNYAQLLTKIENVITFAGQSVVVSFYAKADTAKPIAIEFAQVFGSGGSPSATVIDIGAQKINLTTSWQKFTTTVSIPSISGKTVGTNRDSVLIVGIWFDAGSNFNSRTDTLGQQSGTFDIAQVQVERGNTATPFEARPIGTELALCQRYYSIGQFRILTNATASSGFGGYSKYPQTMRSIPSLTYSSAVYTNASSVATSDPATAEGNFVFATATTTALASVQTNWTASAEL